MLKNIDFSAFQLKVIAIIAMSLDHSALLFLSDGSWRYECLRFVGRLTLPLMCFFWSKDFFIAVIIKNILGVCSFLRLSRNRFIAG